MLLLWRLYQGGMRVGHLPDGGGAGDQPHTVRGAIAGALKKKLGLKVTSEKVEGRGRVGVQGGHGIGIDSRPGELARSCDSGVADPRGPP